MRKFVAILAATLMLALAGCGGGANAPASSGGDSEQAVGSQTESSASTESTGGESTEPLLIGSLYPLSGSLALLGEESWRGAEIARLVRNEQGGIGGRQIEFVKADAPDVSAAKSEAERLITREGVKLILGSYSSSLSLAATEVAARNGATYFELGAISDPITNRGYKSVFRTNPTASMFARTQIKFVQDYVSEQLGKAPGEIRLSVAHEDSSYGSTVADYIRKEAAAAGIQVVSMNPYSAKAVDLSSVILKLKNDQPDVLIAVSYANDAILFWRQAKELQFDVPVFIGTGGGHSLGDFQDALGSDVIGVFNVDFTQYAVNTGYTPGLEEFVSLYKETFGEDPRSGHSLANFMGAMVLFDILEQTGGSLEPDQIREAAMAYRAEPGTTATGWGVEFDESGQNIGGDPLVTQWREEGLVTVWPEGAAVVEPIMMPTWAERGQ